MNYLCTFDIKLKNKIEPNCFQMDKISFFFLGKIKKQFVYFYLLNLVRWKTDFGEKILVKTRPKKAVQIINICCIWNEILILKINPQLR